MLCISQSLLWTAISVGLTAIPLVAAQQETGFLNRRITVGGATYRYQVYIPPDWSAEKKWPLILFLHGSGERGSDGLLQTEVGLGEAIRRHPDRFPAVVVMPQCRNGVWWQTPEMEALVFAALDAAMTEFHGDPERMYFTGLSMGGYGLWAFAATHPGRFAALAPVCGGIRRRAEHAAEPAADSAVDPFAEAATKIGATPVWVFHGEADPAVPVEESRRMVEALKAAGGNVKYNEYPGVGHNSWDKAYNDPEFAAWLFAQRLKTL